VQDNARRTLGCCAVYYTMRFRRPHNAKQAINGDENVIDSGGIEAPDDDDDDDDNDEEEFGDTASNDSDADEDQSTDSILNTHNCSILIYAKFHLKMPWTILMNGKSIGTWT